MTPLREQSHLDAVDATHYVRTDRGGYYVCWPCVVSGHMAPYHTVRRIALHEGHGCECEHVSHRPGSER